MDMILKRVPGARSCMCIKIYTCVFSRFHGDNDERFWGIFWDMYTSICFHFKKMIGMPFKLGLKQLRKPASWLVAVCERSENMGVWGGGWRGG